MITVNYIKDFSIQYVVDRRFFCMKEYIYLIYAPENIIVLISNKFNRNISKKRFKNLYSYYKDIGSSLKTLAK